MFVHLVLDGVWTDAHEFWWPLFGTSFDGQAAGGRPRRGVARARVDRHRGDRVGMATLRPRRSGARAPVRAHRPVAARARGLMPELRRADRRAPRPDGRRTRRVCCSGAPIRRSTPRVAARPPRLRPRSRRSPTDTRIISSPLRRARETASLIAREGPVEIDERWIELDYGDVRRHARSSTCPATTWARWRSDLDFAPGGGESIRDLGERVAAACADLLDRRARRATSSSSPTCHR